jgi:hypothetical protein
MTDSWGPTSVLSLAPGRSLVRFSVERLELTNLSFPALCCSQITHLFSCPNLPPPSLNTLVRPPLAGFVAYALYRTQLPPSVTTASLLLLARLKARYPQAKGSSGHRLFIAAFMMASKNLCDDTYSNKSWCIVAQSMFPLSEINQMVSPSRLPSPTRSNPRLWWG